MRGVVILLSLLLIPAAIAVSDVQLLVNGEPLSFVGPGNEMTVQLSLTNDRSSTFIDVRSENIPGGGTGMNIGGCTSCVRDLRITTGPTITLSITEAPDYVPQEFTIQLQIDSSPPVITRIGVGDCQEVCSYSTQDTELIVELTDQGAGIDQSSIRISVSGQRLVPECESVPSALRCTVQLPVGSDHTVRVDVRDLAGNAASKVVDVRFDDTPPRIIDGPIVVGFTDALPGGLPSKIRVLVEESEFADVSFVSDVITQDGKCTRIRQGENRWNCEVTITPPNEIINIPIQGMVIVTDGAGNTDQKSLSFTVLQTNFDIDPNIWAVTANAAGTLDANTLRAFDKEYQIQLQLRATDTTGAEPIRIRAQNCKFGSTGVVAQDIVPSTNPTIHLTIPAIGHNQGRGAEFVERDITCQISTLTRIGNTVYGNEEVDEITVRPAFTRLPPPAEAVQQEREDLQESINSQQQLLRTANIGVVGMSSMCGVPEATLGLSTVLTGVALGLPPGFRNAVGGAADSTEEVTEKTSKVADPICAAIACEDPFGFGPADIPGLDLGVQQLMDTGVPQAIAGAERAEDLIDPYESIFLAAATGCVPAILYQWQLKLGNDCNLQGCIENIDITQRTLAECKEDKRYLDCRWVAGGAINAIPAINMLDNLRDRFVSAFRDPATLLGLTFSGACHGFGGLPCKLVERTEDLSRLVSFADRTRFGLQRAQNIFSGNYCGDAARRLELPPRPAFYENGQDWCRAGMCRFQSGGETYYSTSRGIYRVAEATEQDPTLSTVPAPPTDYELVAGGELHWVRVIDTDENTPPTDGTPWISEDTAEVMIDAAELNNEYVPDGIKDLKSYDDLRTKTIEVASNNVEIERIEQDIKELYESPEMQEARANPDSQESQDLFYQYEQYQLDLIEEIIEIEEKNEELEEELEDLRNNIRTEALREEYMQWAGAIRRHLGTMRTFGYAGEFLSSTIGVEPMNIIGINSTAYRQTVEDIASTIGLIDLDSELSDAICKHQGDQALYTVGFSQLAGDTAIRIAAASDTTSVAGRTQYQYLIDAYIGLDRPVDQTAQLILKRGGTRFVIPDTTITLQSRRAYIESHASDQRYDEACIKFANNIWTYSVVGPGIDENSNEVCTTIQGVRP